MPHIAAGTRIEPCVSSATPSAAMRVATATAVPPLLSARNTPHIVRVVYRTERQIVARPSERQFVQVRLPQNNGSGSKKRTRNRSIFLRTEIPQRGGSSGCRYLLRVYTVLHRNRQSVQRTQLCS